MVFQREYLPKGHQPESTIFSHIDWLPIAAYNWSHCSVGLKAVGSSPKRDKTDKWHIPESVYPYKEYPPRYHSFLHFVTTKPAKQMYYFAESTPYMFTDDVFVGVLASRIPGSTKLDSLKNHSELVHLFKGKLDEKLTIQVFKTTEEKVFFHVLPSSFFSMWSHWKKENQL